jgi:hypothetical protein
MSTRLVDAPVAAGGALLATATQAVARVRPAAKPLHPTGEVVRGRLFRKGSEKQSGVAWIDEAGQDDVEVRRSRAIGLPHTLPDIHGLALRVHTPDRYGDILFATTGRGRVGRFVLTASRHPRRRPLTTLLPYDTDSGPVLLSAEGIGADTYELSWAHAAGDWQPFGVLRLSDQPAEDVDISFDPVLNQLPGLRQYAAVQRLREPSYLRARRSRT